MFCFLSLSLCWEVAIAQKTQSLSFILKLDAIEFFCVIDKLHFAMKNESKMYKSFPSLSMQITLNPFSLGMLFELWETEKKLH